MSDLESVDLSQESGSEASDEMPTSAKPQPPAPASQPTKNATPSTPQRKAPRDTGTRPASTDTPNGTIVADKSRKERPEATTSARPIAPRPASLAPMPPSKPTERAPEKPAEAADEAPKAAPPKPKRGRPRKFPLKRRTELPAADPQESATPATKPAAAPNPGGRRKFPLKRRTELPTADPQESATPATEPAAASNPTAAKSVPVTKQTTAPKPAAKPADGEAPAPRAGGRGRKRRLLTKPAETTQADDRREKAPGAVTAATQQPLASEIDAPPQKPVTKAAERKLYGAARAAAIKRRRDGEEGQVTAVPVGKPSRGKKKDATGPAPEVSEVPASPPQKGRPPKRAKRQRAKEIARTVPQEVIRIEDDDISAEPAAAVASAKEAPHGRAKQSQMKNGTTHGTANSSGTAAGNAAPSRGRVSLPSSFARPAGRKRKTQDTALLAPVNRRLDGPGHDLARRGDEGSSPEKAHDNRIQTRNEVPKPLTDTRPRRSQPVRHSTGSIVPMDTDDLAEPHASEQMDRMSNSEAVKSMLDEIQRNAIPFLLSQDRICDSFSKRIGEDVDVILKNSDNDVFQVFSDRVKDALVADRLRLAVASAKTDLRRGIENLLRDFARKVGAPLAEANSSLLLRNEAFRNASFVKEERRVSKPFAPPSPKISKPVTRRRVTEDSQNHEDISDRDDLSDAPDPLITTPRQPLKSDIRAISNVAGLKKFVGYSYDNLNLHCYRSCAILKLCAQTGGMTLAGLHDITPLGKQMIRNKVRDLVDRGYLTEDIIREDDKNISVFSTAAHVSDT